MIETLKQEMEDVLHNNILSFWMQNMQDNENGGFYGQITGDGRLLPLSNKGSILNARILWTFSAAYRLTRKKEYLEMAIRAKEYLINYFYDKTYGGIYWELDYKGNPVDTKKQIYALGFAIYGLSEYYRATEDKDVLSYAIHLFNTIEKYSFDKEKNGYFEAFTREWLFIEDMRLSEKDANEKKTMNTHLHILEPYTNLYRVWKDDRLKQQIHNLILLFLEKIINPQTNHLGLFFDEDWNNKDSVVSYGHDIEASWLIHEAALELGDKELLEKVENRIRKIAKAAEEGIAADGSMYYENIPGEGLDKDRHWWVQAETVVGYINIYQHFHDEGALHKAIKCWEYTKRHLIDWEKGEWHWSCNDTGQVNLTEDKAGFWKCPYHNGRMCMEIIFHTPQR